MPMTLSRLNKVYINKRNYCLNIHATNLADHHFNVIQYIHQVKMPV